MSVTQDKWYWTDGNDATQGVYKHATTNRDMEWINPKWWCTNDYPYGLGHAFRLLITTVIGSRRVTGAWCDGEVTEQMYFICEAAI